jgi:hypothetical protein
MRINNIQITLVFVVIYLVSCTGNKKNIADQKAGEKFPRGSYGYDAAFLKKYLHPLVELSDSIGRVKILVSPGYQGRVMTSSAGGDSGFSFGWINYDLIAAQKFKPQFNPVGGEERFWLGPEGGQFALYFNKGDSFNLSHWQVPPILDTLPFDLTVSDRSHVKFSKKATLLNYAGTRFQLGITRSIRLLEHKAIEEKLRISLPVDIKAVAFESENEISNEGNYPWKKEKGLLSIWLLGMMTPTAQTIVCIPFLPGPHSREYITDNYFGKIPVERLKVKDSLLFFTCDGKHRSKLGLSPKVAASLAASFDFEKNVLTLIYFPVDRNGLYVNSKWEIQAQPYSGDVVNSYNDGPLADGTQLGPFYEIESSSPAMELKPGETERHQQVTCHLTGNYQSLRKIARTLLGVDLDEMKKR